VEDKITQPLPSQDNSKKSGKPLQGLQNCPLYLFIFFLYSLLFIRIPYTDFREFIIRFLVFNNNDDDDDDNDDDDNNNNNNNNKYKTFNMGNNITCTIHCNYRIAARLCTPEKRFVTGI